MIAILIPTLYRPQNIQRTVKSIRESTTYPFYKIYFMCPEDDIETISEIEKTGEKYWTDSGDMRFGKRIQFMYENTTEDWILSGADDIVFREGWLNSAQQFWGSYGVISFEDMCNPNQPGTNFLISRKYIERRAKQYPEFQTVFHLGYRHSFVDNELIIIAKNDNEFIKCDGVIEHFHPSIGKAAHDQVYGIAQEHFHQDGALFHSREHLWNN